MAKKIVDHDEEEVEKNGGIKAKRKRACCCSCCLIVLIVTLVIFLAAFITGWFLGDKYTKELFDLSMGDTMGVVGDLYWTNDKDVVTNPYSSSDIDGFYSEIKRNILLKDSAEVDFDSALKSAIDKYLGIDASAQALNSSDGEGEGSSGEDDENKSEITDIFVNMIADVLERDNIDIERLNSYPDKDEYIFNLKDRQLAAFVNSILQSVLKNADKMDSLKDIAGSVDLGGLAALKQIRFTAQADADESGNKVVKASSAEITIWLGLQDMANQAVKRMLDEVGQGWAGGIVGWLADVILPENLYLTVSVPLYGEDNTASIVINDMNEEERERANKLINGIIQQINGPDSKTLDEVIDEFVDEIRPMLEKATDKMVFDNANDGYISMDLLDTVAKMASENIEGEGLSKADFLYVLQTLLSEPDAQLKGLIPYRYDNWYMVDGAPVYLAEGSDTATPINYRDEFIAEIEQKYAIDFGEDKDLDSVLKMLGISLDGSESNMGSTDLLEKVDGQAFSDLLNAPDTQNIKLRVTDRMLGAVFADRLPDLLKDNPDISKMNIALKALTFISKADKEGRLYAKLAVDVDLADMLGSMDGGEDSLMNKLVNGLMPDKILLTVTVDISRNISKQERDAAEFVINSAANTDRAVSAMEKLVPDIDLAAISDKVSDMLNDMLDKMNKVLAIELVPSTYEFENNVWLGGGDSAAIVMPDIFTIITDSVLVEKNQDGTETKIVKPDELKAVIRDLNNPHEIESNIDKDAGYSHFIDEEVIDKYYFKAEKGSITTFDGLTDYLADFNTNKFRKDGKNGVAHDDREIDDLRPVMTGGELGALLTEKMQGNNAVKSYNIVRVETGQDRLYVTLMIKISDLMGDATKVQKLITAENLYATAECKLDQINGAGTPDDPYAYEVELTINVDDNGQASTMDKTSTYPAMLKIVKYFMSDFDMEAQIREFGKILYDQMESLENSIRKKPNVDVGGGADEGEPTTPSGADEVDIFTFTDRGMEITDFYTFLALQMQPDILDDHEAKDIKATVQGLYTLSENEQEHNDNNYDAADILFNPPSEKGQQKWTGSDLYVFGKDHFDKDFNGFLKQGVEKIGEEGAVVVEQTIVLAAGDTRDEVANVRKWLNANLELGEAEDVDTASDYLVLTFSMGMGAFIGGAGEGTTGAHALFPEKIYATVVYRYDPAVEGDKFSVVGGDPDPDSGAAPSLVFNNMNGVQYDIMVSLMGASPDSSDSDKINIISIVQQGADVLNAMGKSENGLSSEITFEQTTDLTKGMGIIKFSELSGIPTV